MMNVITQYTSKIANYFKVDDKRGVTAIEYGLIAALVAIGLIAGASALGTGLSGMFNTLGSKMTSAAGQVK